MSRLSATRPPPALTSIEARRPSLRVERSKTWVSADLDEISFLVQTHSNSIPGAKMKSDRAGKKRADRGFQAGVYSYRAILLALLSLAVACACPGQTNVLTYHNDNGRTGQNLNEIILTPANVNATNFGSLGFLPVDGQVDAQPLYVANLILGGIAHNVVFVVTENDSVYAFDADSYAQLWHSSVLGLNETPSDNRGCGQVTPQIGITSTPVIDVSAGPHGTIFVVAMSTAAGTTTIASTLSISPQARSSPEVPR
jgi:hypothetical protein